MDVARDIYHLHLCHLCHPCRPFFPCLLHHHHYCCRNHYCFHYFFFWISFSFFYVDDRKMFFWRLYFSLNFSHQVRVDYVFDDFFDSYFCHCHMQRHHCDVFDFFFYLRMKKTFHQKYCYYYDCDCFPLLCHHYHVHY